jgi:hypothetical protein
MILYSVNLGEGFTIAAISEGTTRTLFLGEKWAGGPANKKPTARDGLGNLVPDFCDRLAPVEVSTAYKAIQHLQKL